MVLLKVCTCTSYKKKNTCKSLYMLKVIYVKFLCDI